MKNWNFVNRLVFQAIAWVILLYVIDDITYGDFTIAYFWVTGIAAVIQFVTEIVSVVKKFKIVKK